MWAQTQIGIYQTLKMYTYDVWKRYDVQLIVIKSQVYILWFQFVGASNFLSLTTYLKWPSKPTNVLRYHM
jgi:hypothetical protein